MIEIKDLKVSYDGNKTVLSNVDLHISEPGIIGIIGPNGAGKSTLMKAILGLVDYDGKIIINHDLSSAYKAIAYVEQRSQIDFNFPITVEECVLLGTYGKLGLFKNVKSKEKEMAQKVLEDVGLTDYAKKPIKALSGGQFQRMLLARCLIQDQEYLFLDEPFVGIDSLSETIIVDLLKKLKSQGRTILIVHHDLSKVEDYFDQVLLINGQIIAFGSVSDVFTIDNLSKTYGNELIVKGGDA
ncbi:metal ABC transporter ATP-binding protein [Streptococcus porcinus]|uniref:Metal ABC transporter ATP-binding protein n=1 Tax=Streptococcus porcinus TaxID=1340 RepID=A0A7W0AQP8_STRPO|nr:metal ABC transporter ATP-binding protein [Streptococcus porcinus]MBA2795421.1 metal ABC transporter ATP-binding protein [Streptococcus porcinus]